MLCSSDITTQPFNSKFVGTYWHNCILNGSKKNQQHHKVGWHLFPPLIQLKRQKKWLDQRQKGKETYVTNHGSIHKIGKTTLTNTKADRRSFSIYCNCLQCQVCTQKLIFQKTWNTLEWIRIAICRIAQLLAHSSKLENYYLDILKNNAVTKGEPITK